MTEDAITHDLFKIERRYPCAPAQVWSAWADPERKWAWFRGAAPMPADFRFDFRAGGVEQSGFTSPMGEHRNHTIYFDIEPERRIVFAYSMSLNGRVHSASVATVEFFDHDGGARLVFTEQITGIGASDDATGRRNGWGKLLDALDRHITAETPA